MQCEYCNCATCDQSVKLSLRANVAVRDIAVALRSVTNRPVAWLHWSHASSITVALPSHVRSLSLPHTQSQSPPPFTTLFRRQHWDYDCGKSLTTGCFFFFFLPLWAGPVPRYFQGTAALLPGAVRANTGSIFYEAASLRACVARSCAGKCPRPGATKQHFWSEAVAAIVRSATVELSREGSWCRCFGQISAMQLVFVFN